MDNEKKYISIIIPCYNEEQYIEELLISLIENISNYKFEIIVVDDCSEDSTFLRLENFNKTNKSRCGSYTNI